VLTGIGQHNHDELFVLGEHLALLGISEWNISRLLPAGRAKESYRQRWGTNDDYVMAQVHDLRRAYPFIRIRHSSRIQQDGYFLLVLPDGSLATQYSGERDKVILGTALGVQLSDLERSPDFCLDEHGQKWISARLNWQPFHHSVDPSLWGGGTIPSGTKGQPTLPLGSNSSGFEPRLNATSF
jgi:hypothetical protein